MRLTESIMEMIDNMKPEIVKRLGEYSGQLEDVVQDCYVKILEAEDKPDNPEGFSRQLVANSVANYVRNERNRRALEQGNADRIIAAATPTLSSGTSGDPAEYAEAQQVIARRWKSLSPFLRRIARKSYFGYTETPEKIARDLGTTVAAVNMARTRIKQHLNGANDVN